MKTDKKSNEITAIPELLDSLDIKDTIVSVDALNCQTEIADKIVSKGGDYLFCVKSNQENYTVELKKDLKKI
ncbi:MAG: ISAs1 family transposase [Bacteriovoracaceae bacterium]|nr:ISAs1 family transposase [Bacteriovoracaceae bacterium]